VLTAGGEVPASLRAQFPLPAKALIPFRGRPLVAYALDALLACGCATRPVAVVGPPEVEAVLAPYGADAKWLQCGRTLMDNALLGLHFHGDGLPLLLLSPDLPAVTPQVLDAFAAAVPDEAELAAPVITREQFLRRFPGAPNAFVHTATGAITMGSAFFITPRVLRINVPLAQDAYRARKYPWRLAYMAGAKITWQLLTRRVRIADVEARVSALCDAVARAVFVDAPELAYDIDSPENLAYLEERTG